MAVKIQLEAKLQPCFAHVAYHTWESSSISGTVPVDTPPCVLARNIAVHTLMTMCEVEKMASSHDAFLQ